jgi:hypothetical protein
MRSDHKGPSGGLSSNPKRPAYDNPVGNKGELAAGNNARRSRPEPASKAPQGHDSDKKLGRKPTRESVEKDGPNRSVDVHSSNLGGWQRTL